MSKTLKGIAASDGIAVAPAYLLVEPDLSFSKTSVSDVDAEVARILNEIEHAPAYQANNCITAVHVERHIVYVSFAPCHGEGGVGVIYNIDAKFWAQDVAKQFN